MMKSETSFMETDTSEIVERIQQRDEHLFESLDAFLATNEDLKKNVELTRAKKDKELEQLNSEKAKNIQVIEEALSGHNLEMDSEHKTLEQKIYEVSSFLENNFDYFFPKETPAKIQAEGNNIEINLGYINTRKSDTYEYVPYSNIKIIMVRHLALSGVDLNKLDIDKFEQFRSKTQDEYISLMDNSRYDEIENNYFKAAEALYQEELISKFEDICRTVVTSKEVTEYNQAKADLELFFDITSNMLTRRDSVMADKLAKLYMGVINVKHKLPQYKQHTIARVLEAREDQIFDTFGIHLFKKLAQEHLKQDRSPSIEALYAEMFGITKEEKKERRTRNWKQVNNYIYQFEQDNRDLEIEDLGAMHEITMQGIVPKYATGFRFHRNNAVGAMELAYTKTDVYINDKGVKREGINKKEDLIRVMSNWVYLANKIGHSAKPEIMAQIDMGKLMAQYVNAHPHAEGNGTVVIFAVEAIKAMRHTFDKDRVYETNHDQRIAKTLGYNPFALAAVKLEHEKAGTVQKEHSLKTNKIEA